MTYEDRLWSDLVDYFPGDVVVVEEPVRRSFIDWLLRRPRRTAPVEYICQSARNDRWKPVDG